MQVQLCHIQAGYFGGKCDRSHFPSSGPSFAASPLDHRFLSFPSLHRRSLHSSLLLGLRRFSLHFSTAGKLSVKLCHVVRLAHRSHPQTCDLLATIYQMSTILASTGHHNKHPVDYTELGQVSSGIECRNISKPGSF